MAIVIGMKRSGARTIDVVVIKLRPNEGGKPVGGYEYRKRTPVRIQ